MSICVGVHTDMYVKVVNSVIPKVTYFPDFLNHTCTKRVNKESIGNNFLIQDILLDPITITALLSGYSYFVKET